MRMTTNKQSIFCTNSVKGVIIKLKIIGPMREGPIFVYNFAHLSILYTIIVLKLTKL